MQDRSSQLPVVLVRFVVLMAINAVLMTVLVSEPLGFGIRKDKPFTWFPKRHGPEIGIVKG